MIGPLVFILPLGICDLVVGPPLFTLPLGISHFGRRRPKVELTENNFCSNFNAAKAFSDMFFKTQRGFFFVFGELDLFLG